MLFFLRSLKAPPTDFVVMDDFNIHCDRVDAGDTTSLMNLLESCNLKQHVHQKTHNRGHTLDLVYYPSSETLMCLITLYLITHW